jgi:hypothetical protein
MRADASPTALINGEEKTWLKLEWEGEKMILLWLKREETVSEGLQYGIKI